MFTVRRLGVGLGKYSLLSNPKVPPFGIANSIGMNQRVGLSQGYSAVTLK
jgi:hypothetical protein